MDLNIYYAKPNKTIQQHNDELLEQLEKLNSYNYINKELYNTVKKACIYHDMGKVNDEFQKRVTSENRLKFDENIEVGHNILSTYFIDPEKCKDIEDEYIYILNAVLNHHSYCDNITALRDNRELSKKLLENFDLYDTILQRSIKDVKKKMNHINAILIKGFLQRCDYSASGCFEIEYKNDFLLKSINDWYCYKKFEQNELQQFCINNSDENIIAVAQTGMGKTEAGLLWIGDNKGFFVLPLKIAINAIYHRVKDNFITGDVSKKVALLHSDTLLEYGKVDSGMEMDILDYHRASKNMTIPLTITTIDQIFKFVFKYEGFETMVSTLSYAKVVIDEIQVYSPDLLAYLISGIKYINKAGGKVAIVTATLPPFVVDELEQKVHNLNLKKEVFINDDKPRHNVKTYDKYINSDFIYYTYVDNKSKLLVVCNTVKKSQTIYKELIEKGIPINEINLLHSKFTKGDRGVKEDEIRAFGETDNIEKGIWIATSIVEASLDIDFDILITELQELSSFFQRLGRCNRRGKKDTTNTNCYLFLKMENKLLIDRQNDKGIVDKTLHKLSYNVLVTFFDDKSKIFTENDKLKLINENYTSSNMKNSHYLSKFNDNYEYIETLEIGQFDKNKVIKEFRNIVAFKAIPKNVYDNNKECIDECVYNLNSKEISIQNRVSYKEQLDNFTLSLRYYELGKNYTTIKVNQEQIYIIECDYDNKIGFEINKDKSMKQSVQSNFL